MAKTKHLTTKYSVARYSLIKVCSGDELRWYLYVKLYAINKHSAFPSQRSFFSDLGWSKYTVTRIAKEMEAKNRLKVLREVGKNNVYNITWYDEINEKGTSQETLTSSGQETLTTTSQETLTRTIRKKTIRNKLTVGLTDKWEFSINSLLENNQRHIHIIGLYWQYKDFQFENKDQYQSGLRRELIPARNLVGYTDDQITDTMDWLIENTKIKWTLETIHKYIDENISNLKPQYVK